MDPRVSALERAFQLAGSGQVATVDDIKKRLKLEGYDPQVVNGGPLLASQLRQRIKAARWAAPVLERLEMKKGGPKPPSRLH